MRVWRNPEFSDRCLLYGANTSLGWRVVRNVSRSEGERGVEKGRFRRVHDEITGKLIGYQIVGTAEQRGDKDLPSVRSGASISRQEMEANAGACGRSRTAGLAEDDRVRRHPKTGELLPMEDFVERTVAKVRVYPFVGAAKGDILRAWPK